MTRKRVIPSRTSLRDRQAILMETLRVLKKGGTFAIHDLGYEQVELIPTDGGRFMSPWEARWMALGGSAILFGKK